MEEELQLECLNNLHNNMRNIMTLLIKKLMKMKLLLLSSYKRKLMPKKLQRWANRMIIIIKMRDNTILEVMWILLGIQAFDDQTNITKSSSLVARLLLSEPTDSLRWSLINNRMLQYKPSQEVQAELLQRLGLSQVQMEWRKQSHQQLSNSNNNNILL